MTAEGSVQDVFLTAEEAAPCEGLEEEHSGERTAEQSSPSVCQGQSLVTSVNVRRSRGQSLAGIGRSSTPFLSVRGTHQRAPRGCSVV